MLKIKKRALSLLTLAAIMLTSLPTAVLANETSTTSNAIEVYCVLDGNSDSSKFWNKGNFTISTYTDTETSNAYWKLDTTASTYFSIAGSVNPNGATSYRIWSLDFYNGSSVNFNTIALGTNGSVRMTRNITKSELIANAWNNIAVVYSPNATDTTKTGKAELYINGVYDSIKDTNLNNSTYGTEFRFYFDCNNDSTTKTAYIDNVIVVDVPTFKSQSPEVLTNVDGISIVDNKITGYGYNTKVSDLATMFGKTITVKNGNTTVGNDGIVEPGMKIEFSGFTAVSTNSNKTYTHTPFELGVPYKLLASVTGENSTALLDAVNITKTENIGSIGGKDSDDKCIKIVASGELGRFAISDGTAQINCNAGDIILYGFDIYAESGLKSIKFMSTSNAARSYELDASTLTSGAWNKVLLVLYGSYGNTGKWSADLYVNSELKKAAYQSGGNTVAGPLRLAFYPTTGNNATVYLDNINVATVDAFERPTVSSDSILTRVLAGQEGSIDGYGETTVGQMKADLSVDAIYTENSETASDSDAVVPKMYIWGKKDYSNEAKYGFFANNYIYRYNIAAADYTFGKLTATVQDGKLIATRYMNNFLNTTVSGTAILAEFDAQNRLVKIADTTDFSIGRKYDNTYTITLEATDYNAEHTYRVLIWNSLNGMVPMKDVETVTVQ